MNNTWTRIAQANLDHYNKHPRSHTAITVAYGVTVLVGLKVAMRRMSEKDLDRRVNRHL